MTRTRTLALVAIAASLVACDGAGAVDVGGTDASRMDAGPRTCATDTDCPDTYCNPGSLLCCVPASPPYEICGDRIDQNCDRRDVSCGDTDRDGVQACRPGEDPTSGTCDCDDERADVRPPFGTVAGAPEVCDGADNDCNGRVDESAQCCEGCALLGEDRDRADVCTVDGACDCSSAPGTAPCDAGQICCTTGCVDVRIDAMNCGFCGAVCTGSSDRCVDGDCRCGADMPCDLNFECVDGVCQTP
jgi:hypothetical protein